MKDSELIEFEWRTGRPKSKEAKCVYVQLDEKPSKDDILIGEMKSPTVAKEVVETHNGQFD